MTSTTQLAPPPVFRQYDNNNNPLVGGQLFTYIAGTSTPQATYTDSTGSTPNTNPVILNSRGEANVWLTPGLYYKIVLEDSVGNIIWTVDQVSSVASANNLSYLAPFTGSVSRTLSSKLSDEISVKDFGATGNGSTDDTAAIQAAINAVGNGILFFPPGTYIYTTLNAPSGCAFRGSGQGGTILRTSSATANAITCTDTLPYEFSDIQFGATVTRTAGDFIKIVPSGSGENAGSIFRRCSFPLAWNAIEFVAAYTWVIEDCNFQGHLSTAVIVANTAVADTGDSTIQSCLFNTTTTTAQHILQASSGGLRIKNNKFLGAGYHYLGQFNAGSGGPTSILIFEGNSSEGATVGNITLTSQSSSLFGDVLIRDNQFSVLSGAVGITLVDPGYVWLDNVNIGGNTIALDTGSSTLAISAQRCTRLTIDTNQIVGNNVEAGIAIGANVTSGIIAPQDMTNILVPWEGAGLANVIFSPGRREAGTVTASTTTTLGSTFITALQTVTFAQAYAKAPSVNVTMNNTGSALSAVLGTVSTTGFQVAMIGFVNSTSLTCNWQAEG